MKIILGILFVAIITALYVAIDFLAFRRRARREENGVPVHAGGLLSVSGGKTYYTLPKGERRKLADYPFDLTPGSADMQKFETIMARAYQENEKIKAQAEKDAVTNMHIVAREAVKHD